MILGDKNILHWSIDTRVISISSYIPVKYVYKISHLPSTNLIKVAQTIVIMFVNMHWTDWTPHSDIQVGTHDILKQQTCNHRMG